jgi:hypothetical protein
MEKYLWSRSMVALPIAIVAALCCGAYEADGQESASYAFRIGAGSTWVSTRSEQLGRRRPLWSTGLKSVGLRGCFGWGCRHRQ